MSEPNNSAWPFTEITESEGFDIDAIFGTGNSASQADPFAAPAPVPAAAPAPVAQEAPPAPVAAPAPAPAPALPAFCTNCGNKYGPNDRFCPMCGNKRG